jgi:PadR family transcriptional regulator, regulatory protein AphA
MIFYIQLLNTMRGKINPFTSSEFALLGLLYKTPTHGYELHKQITDPEGIGMIWGVKLSNLYAQINKLEKKGYITGIVHAEDSRPARTEYHITESGKTIFTQWIITIVDHPRDMRQEFMLRLFFLLKYHPEMAKVLCSRQLAECNHWLKNTQSALEKVNEEKFYEKSVVQFRIYHIRSIIDWLENLEKDLP